MTNNLGEHIGTIIWIAVGLLTLVGILVGIIWNDLGKKIEDLKLELKEDEKKFPQWLGEISKEGGVITRNEFFKWCGESQEKCPVKGCNNLLLSWRNAMLEKGGVVTKDELAKEKDGILDKALDRLDECFDSHREWVGRELKMMQTTMEKQILTEILALKKELEKKNGIR